jgi:hypothetical protein
MQSCLTSCGQVILQLFHKVLKITATNVKLLGLTFKTITDIAFGLQLFFLSVTIFKDNGM